MNRRQYHFPYRIILNSGGLFSFAGLWEKFTDKENDTDVYSFTIVTTDANDKVSDLHDRMPVFLNPDTEKIWLNDELDTREHLDLLHPYPDDDISVYQVSTDVNSPKNDNPEIVNPITSN
jgi:putative SOS response-associated peptidase YedK